MTRAVCEGSARRSQELLSLWPGIDRNLPICSVRSSCSAFWMQPLTAGPPQLGVSDVQHGASECQLCQQRPGWPPGWAGLLLPLPPPALAVAGSKSYTHALEGLWKKHPEAEQFCSAPEQKTSPWCCLTNLGRAAFSLMVVDLCYIGRDQEENVPLIRNHCQWVTMSKGFWLPFTFQKCLTSHIGKDFLGSCLNRWKVVNSSEKIACMFVSI